MSTKQDMEKGNDRSRFKFIRVVMVLLCLVIAASIFPVFSYNPLEADYLRAGLWPAAPHINIFGRFGTRLSWFFLMLFGITAYPLVAMMLASSIRRLLAPGRNREISYDYIIAYIVFACGLAMLVGVWPNAFPLFTDYLNLHSLPGGTIGQRMSSPSGILTLFMNSTGALLLSLCMTLVSFCTIVYSDWQPVIRNFIDSRKKKSDSSLQEAPFVGGGDNDSGAVDDEPAEFVLPVEKREKRAAETAAQTKKPAPEFRHIVAGDGNYTLPGLDLLDAHDGENMAGVSDKEIENTKKLLQASLNNLKIDAQVQDAIVGPQVTLFEIKTAPGLKLSTITGLEKNFLMDLSAQSLRILAPIPGKDLVGMEVPNEKRAVVPMKTLMQDKAWLNAKEQIPLLLGKDISNKTQILDLAKAPHVLVAGTTGSGKSVCMNLLIESMLFRFGPEQLRFIMVDPKVVEFQVYSSLPHLIVPVINEPTQVPLALQWAINEMERRYRILALAGVREISAYNKRPPRPDDAAPILDENGEPLPDKLPYIVVIIDELADIMLVAKSEVENKLSRIAAKSRAVGIHTIIATQRPDVRTLTGTIKANYPVRIAFKTASQVDSQTIINGKGAESLLGMGDMLFVPPGASDIRRIQCGMASDDERNRVVEFVSAQAPQNFDESVLRPPEDEEEALAAAGADGKGAVSDKESMFEQAVDIVITSHHPTISYLQRCLGIGYNKAASLMEELEKRGVVSPQIGTAPRQVLIKSADEVLPEDD